MSVFISFLPVEIFFPLLILKRILGFGPFLFRYVKLQSDVEDLLFSDVWIAFSDGGGSPSFRWGSDTLTQC